MADDKKTVKDIPKSVFESLTKEQQDDIAGGISERELDILLNRYREKGKKEKDSKPKKNPIGAALLYAKKGGMVRKSKVAGRLAKRGYGKAMMGKK